MITSLLAAVAWAATNFWLLMQCLQGMLGTRRYTRWQWAGLLGLKMPVLYGLAWYGLRHPQASPIGCALGITMILGVGVGLAARQAWRLARCEQGGAT